MYKLRPEQKDFIKHWFKKIGNCQESPYLANEEINAFATLVKAPPQAISEYIHKRLNSTTGAGIHTDSTIAAHQRPRDSLQQSNNTYTVREANKHLDSTTLDCIEKYVLASQRRRTQSDGRRRVNQGPYRCTFGCGYCTKRSFDWRRHEETHEPQELWHCHLCKQNGETVPFLVNRKDKFIQHAKDSHKGRDAEDVLEMSSLDFRAKFNPRCPMCTSIFETWDERCKHVILHYEDEIHARKLREATDAASVDFQSASDENGLRTEALTPSSSSWNEDDRDTLTSKQYT
ncbi:hypothetical protein B0J11DRAFT_434742 [Dendryphion nanum]|uniref:C2H2-type domain-containing protein n=1 Tax=Dendryphion nanum TaxID=256645 RepID=A0A9P9DVT3_9PLEO|nr:hypothetical protein B0J11DRAFT_434742 [Dendryphion nanum]